MYIWRMPSISECSYYRLSLVLLAFSIPLYFNLQSVFTATLIISWIGSKQYIGAWQRIKERSFSIYWIALFIVYLISLTYSINFSAGWADILRKLSLFLLPLFIASSNQIDQPTFIQIHRGFVIGCLVAMVICLGGAGMQFPELGMQAFFNDPLASSTHNNAVNLSIKCLYALLFMLNYKKPFRKLIQGQTLIIALLFIFLILLASKTTLVLTIFFMLVLSGRGFQTNFRKRKQVRIAVLVSVVLLAASLLIKDSPVLKRFDDLTNFFKVKQSDQEFDVASTDNLSKRLVLWKAALTISGENNNYIHGVGIGDVKDVKEEMLNRPNFSFKPYTNLGSLSALNFHNMYLQSLVAAGIPALILLLLLSFGLLAKAIRSRFGLFTQFLLLFSLFLMQESSFQTQAGLVFFCFFHIIFISLKDLNWKLKGSSD